MVDIIDHAMAVDPMALMFPKKQEGFFFAVGSCREAQVPERIKGEKGVLNYFIQTVYVCITVRYRR